MGKICLRCKKNEPTTTACRYCDLCRKAISKEYCVRQKEYSRERSVYIHKKYKEDPFIGIRNRLMSKVAMKKIYHANKNHHVASRLRLFKKCS